jgi:hypothetical protein
MKKDRRQTEQGFVSTCYERGKCRGQHFEPAGNRGHASDAATFRRNNKERFWGVNMKQKLFGFLNLILMLAATTAPPGERYCRVCNGVVGSRNSG